MNKKVNRAEPPVLLSQVGVLYRTVRKNVNVKFKDQGFPLDLDQIPVLLIVYYAGSASQQAMGVTLQRDKASINRTVGFLVSRGFVTVEPDPENSRKTLVKPTLAGIEYARQADDMLNQYNDALANTLTPEEQQTFHTLINKLIEAEKSTPLNFSL